MSRLPLVLTFLTLPAAYSQPFIFYRGIVNAASYAPQGLPNGSIARGSVFSIFGRNFGPAQPAQVSAFPLGTTFQGVGVSVCQGGNCIPAIPLFVSASQVNAIMPSNAPLGPVSLRVVFNGQGGYYASANVVASSFGIFTVGGGGFGPGSVQNFVADTPALPINSTAAAARPGQTVILWGTGLGAGLNADNVAPQAGDLPTEVEIWVGGKRVTTRRYSGRTPCCAGVDQLVFDLPADTPTGCYVPIQVRTDRRIVSNSVSIAVSADGGACSDGFNPLSSVFRTGGRTGIVFANRFNTLLIGPETQPEHTVEFAVASFRRENGGAFAYNALTLPPPGSCTVHAVPGDFFGGAILPAFRGSGAEMSAGAGVSIGGATVSRSTYYAGTLAGTLARFRDFNLPVTVLDRSLRVQGTAGSEVGPFTLDLPAAPSIRWTDRAIGKSVARDGGFTVNWESGDPASTVVIAGVNANVPANASALFVCTAVPGSRSFAVPPYITQGLPVSAPAAVGEFRFGYAMAGALPLAGAAVSPPAGLDAAIALVASWSARALEYR